MESNLLSNWIIFFYWVKSICARIWIWNLTYCANALSLNYAYDYQLGIFYSYVGNIRSINPQHYQLGTCAFVDLMISMFECIVWGRYELGSSATEHFMYSHDPRIRSWFKCYLLHWQNLLYLKTSVYGSQHFYRYKIFFENLLQMWEGVYKLFYHNQNWRWNWYPRNPSQLYDFFFLFMNKRRGLFRSSFSLNFMSWYNFFFNHLLDQWFLNCVPQTLGACSMYLRWKSTV